MAKKVAEKSTTAKKTSVAKTASKKAVKPATKTPVKPLSKEVDKKLSAKKETAKKAIPVAELKSKSAPKKSLLKAEPVKSSSVVTAKKSTAKIDKKVVVDTKPLPTIVTSAKLKPVKSILISQPKPDLGKSPYIDLANQFKIKLDWRPFTHVEGIKAADFRKQKIIKIMIII